MKNRVNFYRDDLKPKVILVNLNFLVFMSVLSLLLVIAGWGWAHSQYAAAEQRVDTLLAEVKQKKFLAESLIETKDSRTQDKSILAAIEQNQQELDVKLTILDELSQRETQRSHGFSDLMLDLAANHQQSLWLNYINLDERKLYVEGTATDSEALPKWINKLAQANYFYGKEFAGARMYRNEQKLLNFVLSSELDDVQGAVK